MAAALAALGVDDDDLDTTVDHFIAAEERGNGGVERLAQLAAAARRDGLARPTPMTVISESPGTAFIDGGGHLGYAVADRATRLAIANAKQNGIAVVGAGNHRYSGVIGIYAEHVAREGLVAVAISTSTLPSVAPFGGREAALSTNPIAVGIPTRDGPVVFDASTAALSLHALGLAARDGEPLPGDVAVDAAGAPTRDPAAALAGAVLPWGGHRGGGLAVAIQLLGLLAGLDAHPGVPGDWEAAFVILAIDPGVLLPDGGYEEAAAAFAAGIRATEPLEGHDAVRMPGDRSIGRREQRLRFGLPVPPAILEELRALAERSTS